MYILFWVSKSSSLGATRCVSSVQVLCVSKNVIKIETVAEEYVCAVGVRPDSDPKDASEELGNLTLGASRR